MCDVIKIRLLYISFLGVSFHTSPLIPFLRRIYFCYFTHDSFSYPFQTEYPDYTVAVLLKLCSLRNISTVNDKSRESCRNLKT